MSFPPYSIRTLCGLWFLLHFLIAHLILPALHKSDVFPLYQWDLFSFKASIQDRYFLRILDIDGVQFAPPLIDFRSAHLLPEVTHHNFPGLVQRFGDSLRMPRATHRRTQEYRAEMERYLFGRYHSSHYQLAHARVGIRILLELAEPPQYTVLGEFRYRREP